MAVVLYGAQHREDRPLRNLRAIDRFIHSLLGLLHIMGHYVKGFGQELSSRIVEAQRTMHDVFNLVLLQPRYSALRDPS